MSFMINGIERKCPVFVPGRERLPCERWECLAYEEIPEFIENEIGEGEKYISHYCHALKKELALLKVEKGEENEA